MASSFKTLCMVWWFVISVSFCCIVAAFTLVAKFQWIDKQKVNRKRTVQKNPQSKHKSPVRKDEFDVIIAGAGPAGSATAFFCGKQKMKVCLLDKAEFPRESCCAGIVASRGCDVLEEIGVLETLRNSGHVFKPSDTTLISPGGFSCQARDVNSVVIQRVALDHALTQAAKNVDVQFKSGWAVEDAVLDPDAGMWTVTSSTGERVKGRVLVLADGSKSALAAKLHMISEDAASVRSVAVAVNEPNVRTLKSDAMYVFDKSILPGFAYVSKESDRSATYGCCLNRGYEKGKLGMVTADDMPSVHDSLLRGMGDRVALGSLEFGEMKSGLTRTAAQGLMASWREHLLIVGDAAGFVDPLTGSGIHTALMSGKCAAETVKEVRREGDFSYRSCSLYQDRWINSFGYDFEFSREVAMRLYDYPILLDSMVILGKVLPDPYASIFVNVLNGSLPKEKLLEFYVAIPLALAIVGRATYLGIQEAPTRILNLLHKKKPE